jgi:hypothetical protein
MNRRFSRLAALLGAGALALAIAAPAAAADPAKLTAVVTADDNGTPAAGQAWVRVLHGSPDAPQVDVYVGADLASAAKVEALSGLSFGQISDYFEVAPGTYAVKVCASADATVCPIEVASLDLAADTKYTVAASDLLASIKANVFVDDPDTAETAQAQVRVVHLSADTPSVDVLAQDGSSIGVDGLTYPNRAPATGYAKFPAGSYDLKVCASADHTLCPIDPGALDLAGGTAYSVFAVGSLAATLPPASPAASPTPPPTDTAIAETAPTSTGNGILVAFGIVSLAAAAALALVFRFSARRIER